MDTARQQRLRQTHLFAAFAPEQMQQACSALRVHPLDDGQRLFEQGQPADRFFFVHSGEMKLFRLSPNGQEKVIEVIRAGGFFAEAMMFMERPAYPVSAQAIGDSEVWSFDNAAVLRLLRASSGLCLTLLGELSIRLHGCINEIEQLTLQNARLRLAAYLLSLLPAAAGGAVQLTLDTPKHVVASRVSVTPETLSRILHQWSVAGLLDWHGNQLHVPDIANFRSQAG